MFPQPFAATPFSKTPFQTPKFLIQPTAPVVQEPPEASLPRILQYAADLSGCGFWRMIWPEHYLNAQGKALVHTSTIMTTQDGMYSGLQAVRVQRQATVQQLEFVHYLKHLQKQFNFRLIYEIDDVVFKEDIPDYNKFKFAFDNDETRRVVTEIMNLCDEVTVTNDFMRDYFRGKLGKKEVTVIPNFPPEWWCGQFFNPQRNTQLLQKNKKKPRVLYAGSGAHFDVENKTGFKDDFEHVIKAIIDSRHKYQWVFMGAAPMQLIPYIQKGDMEFHNWQTLYDYPKKLSELGVQMMVAPLQDNNFNKCKSDIKYIEACAYGLPVACQDLCTYKDAPIKFNSGEEMLHCIEDTLRRTNAYSEKQYKYRKIAESRFLERNNNIECYSELFATPYGSNMRTNLNRYNNSI